MNYLFIKALSGTESPAIVAVAMEHNGKRKQPGEQVTWGHSRSPGSSCFQIVIPELGEYFPNISNVPSPYVCGLNTKLMA